MDKRKFNGGNSTKSKGIDRRKNEYKTAIMEAVSLDDIKEVINKIKYQALRGNTQAQKLLLEYTAGKPTDNLKLTNDRQNNTPHSIELTTEEIRRINKVLEDEY